MTTRNRSSVPPPTVLPRSPDHYDQYYMNNLIKQLQSALDDNQAPSIVRGGELFLTNIPSRGAGLPTGSVFEDMGVLKIIRSKDAYADSFSSNLVLGSITVST